MVLDPRIAIIDQQILELVANRVQLLRESEAGNASGIGSNSNAELSGDTAQGGASRPEGSHQSTSIRLAEHCVESIRSATNHLASSLIADDGKGIGDKHAVQQLAESVIPHIAGVTYQFGRRKIQIAYLGPEFSYSYSAACKFFGASDGFQAVQTIGAVFDEVTKGNSQYGVVPIENSTDGRIVDTLTKFIRTPVHICGEIHLPIHHNLLARCNRSEIREVHSKPQALSQCRAWLTEHLPNARWVEVASTALAARIASETPYAAAVASRDAGIALGLDLVAESIEDNKNNVTRFAVIGGSPAAPTGDDKTSLMFQVPHKPGALADVMLIFRDNHLNLSWIESFPLPGSKNEYIFFVDIEGHIENANVKKAVEAVERLATRFNCLGSYPKGSLAV